ncbi:MAG: hypothetical protein JWP01_2930 [Myxococcales bacterium]|nr:hypothetical protein [Myxococcales bacterium]
MAAMHYLYLTVLVGALAACEGGTPATDGGTGSDGTATPSAIDPVIAAMPPNSWKALPGTHMADVCPTSQNHYACKFVIDAWGGGAYDTLRERMIVFGGGHADSFYNNVFTFDLGESTWHRDSELPAAVANLSDGEGVPEAFRDIRIENCGLYPSVATLSIPPSFLTGSGYMLPGKCDDPSIIAQLDPQQPRSTHTYGNIAFSPMSGLFYNLGSSALYVSGQSTSPRTMAFDVSTGQWARKADNLHIQIGGSSAADAAGRIYYTYNNGVSRYDPATDEWTDLPGGSGTASYQAGAAVDMKRNKLVVTETGATIQTWDLTQASAPRTAVASMGLAAPLPSQLGFEYVKSLDRFVAYGGGDTMYWLSPETNTWTALKPTGDQPGMLTNGLFGRLRYSPRHNVLVLVTSVDADVFIYKPPATAP